MKGAQYQLDKSFMFPVFSFPPSLPPRLDYQTLMDSDSELEDHLSAVELPSSLTVFSASSGGRKDIDSGDKIILSPQILIACEQMELSYPMVRGQRSFTVNR